MKINYYILMIVLAVSGCSMFKSVAQNTLGISRQGLEDARSGSIYQIYPVDMAACFKAVLDIAHKNKYVVFSKDEIRGVIVLMNIPGAVDTTEVGVFVEELSKDKGVRVEVSSRSSPAKKSVAKVVFGELSELFK